MFFYRPDYIHDPLWTVAGPRADQRMETKKEVLFGRLARRKSAVQKRRRVTATEASCLDTLIDKWGACSRIPQLTSSLHSVVIHLYKVKTRSLQTSASSFHSARGLCFFPQCIFLPSVPMCPCLGTSSPQSSLFGRKPCGRVGPERCSPSLLLRTSCFVCLALQPVWPDKTRDLQGQDGNQLAPCGSDLSFRGPWSTAGRNRAPLTSGPADWRISGSADQRISGSADQRRIRQPHDHKSVVRQDCTSLDTSSSGNASAWLYM